MVRALQRARVSWRPPDTHPLPLPLLLLLPLRPSTQDMFGHVRTDASRGLYYLFYTYNAISGGAVLAALVAGDAAVQFEARPQQECVAEVMELLRGIFEPQGVAVPEPLQVRRCRGRGHNLHAPASQQPCMRQRRTSRRHQGCCCCCF